MSEYIFVMTYSWCLSLMKTYDLIYELFSYILTLDGKGCAGSGIRCNDVVSQWRSRGPHETEISLQMFAPAGV